MTCPLQRWFWDWDSTTDLSSWMTPAAPNPAALLPGAASKGACIDNAGTLAHFEIQDIIKNEKPKIIHDEEATVNYIVFRKEQWVSFDDKTRFKQKMDWANEVGMRGVMIWSVDQDDDEFSALEGLLGKDIDRELQEPDDQKCIMTDCGTLPSCPAGYDMAPFPGAKAFPDTCSGDKLRAICCPVDAMPQYCVWSGGESGRSCHGQCHAGEMTLFHSFHQKS